MSRRPEPRAFPMPDLRFAALGKLCRGSRPTSACYSLPWTRTCANMNSLCREIALFIAQRALEARLAASARGHDSLRLR